MTTTENPVLCERHQGQHPLASDCQWPHLVSPPGRQPRVGHPLTTRD